MKTHHKISHPFRLHRFSISHISNLPALSMNRLLAFSASSLIGVFFPIFLYEFFNHSILLVLIWYLIDFSVKIPFFIWAAKLFSKFGLVTSMVIGTLGAALFYISAYLLDIGNLANPYIFIASSILGLLILSTFYWSPFHVDFASMTKKGRRGKQLAKLYAAQRVIGVIGPLLGGFIIATYSFGVTFLFGLFILLLSLIPLVFLPKTRVQYEFGFFETFRKMFDKKFRNTSISMMSHGAENIVGVIIWPIFLFAVFKGEYLEIGAFATVVVLISLALELFIGKKSDSKYVKKWLKWGTGVYALGWVAKAIVDTVVEVFVAATFHSFGSIIMRTPMDALMYEQAADSGHYIDEYTIIREIALSIGRVLMILILIAVTAWFSIAVSFLVAAVFSLGISRISSGRALK